MCGGGQDKLRIAAQITLEPPILSRFE